MSVYMHLFCERTLVTVYHGVTCYGDSLQWTKIEHSGSVCLTEMMEKKEQQQRRLEEDRKTRCTQQEQAEELLQDEPEVHPQQQVHHKQEGGRASSTNKHITKLKLM